MAQGCIERAAGQEAIDRSCNEAAHDAFALDVDLGVDLGPAVELADVVVHVHLDERADGGEAQGLGARLVNLDVERQVLAGEFARDASLAAGLEAIGVKTLDLERNRGPGGDGAGAGQDFHDLLCVGANSCVGCPCHGSHTGPCEAPIHRL